MARYLYSELANLVTARRNCMSTVSTAHSEWKNRHEDKAEELVSDHMPSGSGFDSGTKLDWDASHGEKLVFTTSFHHMDDNGYYDGWTEHTVTVTPSFDGINMRVSGRNRRDIKDLIHEQFSHALNTNVEWDIMREWPAVSVLGIEIKYEWKDQSTGHMVVRRDGAVLFDSDSAKTAKTYQGSPLELCKAFAVKYVAEVSR